MIPASHVTRKERILVVDDEESMRALLLTFFGKNGYQAVAASNAVDAFKAAAEMEPHVMVIDYRIAGGGGIDLIDRVRRHLPGVQCLFMTAYDAPELLDEARAAGAGDCIRKPFDLLVLLDKVERLSALAEASFAEVTDE
jgi:DNA-binding NtrC family response regulator